jgi:hypothetical protein
MVAGEFVGFVVILLSTPVLFFVSARSGIYNRFGVGFGLRELALALPGQFTVFQIRIP